MTSSLDSKNKATNSNNTTAHPPAKKSRGFAAMSSERLKAIAQQGGRRRAEQLGSRGYSTLGTKGGRTRSAQLGKDGYSAMGRWGNYCHFLRQRGFVPLPKSSS